MEQIKSNDGKGLGIAGLVLGIVAAVISFIPCLGVYAIYPGIVGLALSIVSIIQANKAKVPKGMAIAGLICSLIGGSIAAWQYKVLKDSVNEIQKKAIKNAEEIHEEIEKQKDSANMK